MRASAPALIGVDTGGTFTDLVLVSGDQVRTYKTPSTPRDFAEGVLHGIRALREAWPGEAEPPITLVHSSTVATNALLERKGAKVGLLTTRGFRDVLEIGRQSRPDLYNLRTCRPPPLVPRHLRLEVAERVSAEGDVLEALDPNALPDLLDRFERAGVESVAISLLFSFLHPGHEATAARAARERGFMVSVSSELLPEFREYERTSTTVVNAFVSPVMTRYLERLGAASREEGIDRIRIVQSNGGSLSDRAAGEHAVHTLLSGPAAGLLGAAAMVGQAGGAGSRNRTRLITFDMGGTSTDVSLLLDQPLLTNENVIADCAVQVQMMDIHTVGAGGGSIARIDLGGALHVGPQSAGADPGPACYGKGVQPTVTDANVVLGRIHPARFMGGRMAIDPARADRAIRRLAGRLDASVEDTARAIIRIVNANMERAIRVISVERGYDCRECALVCFGGAGGLHACELAASLRIPRVLVPRHPGVLSAWGAVCSDVVKDYSRTVMRALDDSALDAGEHLLGGFEQQALRELEAEGCSNDAVRFEPSADLRYDGQAYELNVPYSGSPSGLADRFHQAHRLRYGHAEPDAPVRVVTIRLRAVGVMPKPSLTKLARLTDKGVAGSGLMAPEAERELVDRSALGAGRSIRGPALVVEDYATTWLPAGWRVTADDYGHLVLEPEASLT